jgi:hypothetical protein
MKQISPTWKCGAREDGDSQVSGAKVCGGTPSPRRGHLGGAASHGGDVSAACWRARGVKMTGWFRRGTALCAPSRQRARSRRGVAPPLDKLHGRVCEGRPVVEMAPSFILDTVVNGRASGATPRCQRACMRSPHRTCEAFLQRSPKQLTRRSLRRGSRSNDVGASDGDEARAEGASNGDVSAACWRARGAGRDRRRCA